MIFNAEIFQEIHTQRKIDSTGIQCYMTTRTRSYKEIGTVVGELLCGLQ